MADGEWRMEKRQKAKEAIQDLLVVLASAIRHPPFAMWRAVRV
jgi:hypothetical protein